MLPRKRHTIPRERWKFLRLSNLAVRNPLVISSWVLGWAIVGIVSGLFAGLYWNVLELMTEGLQ